MKIVGLILTYNCESMIQRAIDNIPKEYLYKIICADDNSQDNTGKIVKNNNIDFLTHEHLGYGGNLFYGLEHAFKLGATHVVELHGDAQYDFNAIKKCIPLINQEADLILGNRFYKYLEPLRNGMDIFRYFGNIFLTFIGSIGLGIYTRDLFPGFRIYSKNFFETIDLKNTSNNYFFSFEIIAQSKYLNLKICSVPVQCDYKLEHNSMALINGFPAILHTIKTVMLYRIAKLNIKVGIFKNLILKNEKNIK